MMRNLRSVILALLAIILMLPVITSAHATSGSLEDAGPELTSEPRVRLRAVAGTSILFKAQNGAAAGSSGRVPHLVLRRNGALTDPVERTLTVEVSGITVPPPGVTVTLQVETQHGDPDPPEDAVLGAGEADVLDFLMRGSERRIPVWRESRWIANPSHSTLTGATMAFTHTFGENVISGTQRIPMPTDYFCYEVSVIGADDRALGPPSRSAGGLSTRASEHYAFLMENQWIARLPQVPEATEGAAPDELIVYYLDMVPFQRRSRDPATWLAREDVTDYVRAELVPQMVEAFRVQSAEWGFPWHEAWTSYRRGEDAERLSVALSDGRTWYHGRAPRRGHSAISIRVSGGDNRAYDTLTDGLMSTFHHELFHNLQRNINQSSGRDGDIDGAEDVWRFFSEGTAVVASSVAQQDAQFRWKARAYLSNANAFMGYGGQFTDLKTSYGEMHPYHAALYWRFLYEQCGVTDDGALDPRAAMQFIRRALTVLYSGQVVDMSASTDLVGALPEIMDRALSGLPCSFDTYEESLAAFTRALYALRLEDGRCEAPGSPAGCGFYDPHDLYFGPPTSTVSHSGAAEEHDGEIPSSFGVDFIDLILDPAADGRPLTLEFQGAPGAAAEFSVQLWELKDRPEGPELQPVPTPTATPKVLGTPGPGERVSYAIPAVDTAESDRLGVIITRVDAEERADPVGAYTILIR